jgi:spore coat polysaccharide biosynthesis protein SpsF (cytidylyltransferase family)
MLKDVVILTLSFTLFATSANSQSKTTPAKALVVQRIAAEHEAMNEAMNNAPSGDPQLRFQQALISRTVARRQAQLRLDTEKLVALTTELKQHVDKTGVNVLSMDVIKTAQEIQKLAKSVQDKMRNAY